MPYLTTFFLAYVSGISSDILSGILSGNLVYLRRFFDSLCRSGGEHFDPELAVEVRHPELAVQVRRGTLRSIAWS